MGAHHGQPPSARCVRCACRGMVHLEELRLNHNMLRMLPVELGALTALRILDVGGNQIATLEDVQVGAQAWGLQCVDTSHVQQAGRWTCRMRHSMLELQSNSCVSPGPLPDPRIDWVAGGNSRLLGKQPSRCCHQGSSAAYTQIRSSVVHAPSSTCPAFKCTLCRCWVSCPPCATCR